MLTQISMPSVMGILNCSPDSFYASSVIKLDTVLKSASKMCEDGVDIIDIGGESTRPGTKSISLQEELERVLPVIEIIKKELAVFISVDTSKPEVMQAAIDLDVEMINDVNALRAPGAMAVVKNSKASICLMHKQGITETMQDSPQYSNVVSEVLFFLEKRIQECLANGIARRRLCIDPGFGFGKTVEHNKKLLQELKKFKSLGLPILVGLSRKSMIGDLLGKCTEDRLYGSLGMASIALMHGANIIRTHDVAATKQVSSIINQVING